MSEQFYIPAAQRDEMIRSANGVITALVAGDHDAVRSQTKAIVLEQMNLADGDQAIFAGRMAKQLEASAIISRNVLMLLARRLNASENEVHRVLSDVLNAEDLTAD